jgi:Tol biopolymer transport system component
MKTRYIVAVGIIVLLVLAGLISYAWIMRPEVVGVYPEADTSDVAVTSQVRINFSQPMNQTSVIRHLKINPAQAGEYVWDENSLIFTPDQTWPGGQEINVQLEDGGRALKPLTFPMRGKEWSFSTREALLAYLWPSDGPSDIYALNPITGEIHQYTHQMGVLEFTVNNAGNMIYFSCGNASGGADLYEIDLIEETNAADNSYKPKKLLDCGSAQCRSPAISYDSKNLAFEHLISSPKGELGPAQIRNLDLTDLNVKPIGQASHETIQPAWSSTGWLAFYDKTIQAYEVINPKANVRFELINQTGQPGNWSPDGVFYLAPEIMYYPATGDTETGISHLFQYGAQDGTSGDLSKEDNVEDVEGVYSPDGKSIAFSRKYLDMERWSFGRQIWLMNPDGSGAHPITDMPDYNHYDLAWSWDNHILAYVRFNETNLYDPPELWMIEVNGSNPIQLVVGGYSPLWLP